jgi:transcriptional regulator with XRE-family HTH domain
VSTVDSQIALGRSIAERRRRYGWSQPELASLLGRSSAWLSQLERGLIPAESIPVPGALAVAPSDVVVHPEPDSAAAAATEDVGALIDVLSAEASQLGPAILGDRSAAGLSALAARAWALATAREYRELAGLLGALLPELEAAVRADDGQQHVELLELTAISYQACSAALARLGEHDGALTAADRALATAHQAGDLLLAAGSAYMLVRILLDARRNDHAQAIAAAAADALEGHADSGSGEALALCGALTLLRALVAARLGDAATAEAQLARARAMAGRLSRDGPYRSAADCYRSVFGPDHVALYEIAVSIETSALLRASRAEHPGG